MLGGIFNCEAAYKIVAFSALVRFNQAFDFRLKIVINATLLVHIRRASGSVKSDGTIEDATYLLPAFRLQIGALPVS